ncbi:MAG: hypothetical protein HY901_13770 [Deltaproteobacteria bacterium]|nr:hypothetical protein [Deltaproteobacteria bacterium]
MNNTCADTEGGLNAPPGTERIHVWNLIVRRAAATASQTYDLYTEGGLTLDVQNSLFSASPRFTDGREQTSCAGLAQIAPTSGCLSADPLFVSETDFHLQASSPAVDSGMAPSVDATFQALYGLSVAVDRDGRPRPAGLGWDRGAYER